MKVKTYQNQSLQKGLENIKRDLGGEALILGTRSVSVRPRYGLFKKPAWEITAAVEEQERGNPVIVPLTKGDSREAAGGRSQNHVAVAAAPAPAPAPVRDQRMGE